MNDFSKILSQAKELESKMKESQEKIKNITVAGVSGTNSVEVTLNGNSEIVKIYISPETLKEEKTIIEDLIMAAHNNAKTKLKSKTSEEISKATLEMGIPVTTIANMMQIKGVIDGLHTIDVSMLILPILMEMIAYIAESRNVDYDMGTDEDKDIPSEEAILASINRSKMKAPETVQEQVPEEVTMEEDPSVGLMARSI